MKFLRWVVVGVMLLAVAGAWVLQPAVPPQQEAQQFTVPPAASNAACPGAQRLPVGDEGGSGDLAAGSDDRLLLEFGDGESYPVGLGTAWETPLGASLERIVGGDLAGLAALTCLPAGSDGWLVGGSTTLGASARLVLSNPSDAAAEARVTIYGPLGPLENPLVIAVPPRGQEERLIEGVATELPGLVLHVEVTGPGLVAVLQDSRLEGFQPAGTEWVAATVPLTRQVIPSVGSDVEGATGTVRLLAPEGADVMVTLVTEAGLDSWSGARTLTLEPGVVTDVVVPVSGFGALEITSDNPILAAARTVVPRLADEGIAGDLAYDHRWMGGIDDSAETTLAAIVPLEAATLTVYSPVGGTLSVVDASGATVATVQVPARTLVREAITVAPGTRIEGSGRFVWSVDFASEPGFIASLTPVDTALAEASISVVPAPYAPVVPPG